MSADKHRVQVLIPRGSLAVLKSIAHSRNQTISELIDDAVIAKLSLPSSYASSSPLAPASACVICGNALPIGKARYCSDKCRREAHRRAAAESFRRNQAANKQPRRCVICGTLLPDGSKALFCSDACKRQAREARRKRLSQSQPPED